MIQNIVKVLQHNIKHALRRGELNQAAQILDRLKEEAPLSVITRGLELELMLKEGRLEQARPLAEQLLELFPDSGRVLYLAGQLAYRLKDYSQAEKCFRESLHVFPHWLTRRWLGKTLSQTGQFEEAEALLLEEVDGHPQCRLDLAWLYERRNEYERALSMLDHYLKDFPDDTFAEAQCLRLRARILAPEELIDEVETLHELGEEISPELMPEYVETLLATGQGGKVRLFIRDNIDNFELKLAARLAWVCHKLQAYDVALELFLKAFPDNLGNFKYLSALESAAAHCGRVEELVRVYETHAPEAKNLYGRIKRLKGGLG